MQFRSSGSDIPPVSFREAVFSCLPDSGGLYVPDKTADLRQLFLYMDENTGFPDLVASVTPSLLEGALNPVSALRVAQSAFSFEPELVRLDEDYSLLNLYNGPTGLFRDFGIAFLAAVLEELLNSSGHLVVLSAVRGDTGVSIANAFSRRKGITSVLVYPSGPVCGLDPSDFVSSGGNIIPVQIRGTFDDCQRLVNETIRDRKFSARYSITSANTINPGRLLPQTFYYLYAFIKIKKQISGGLAFSVPCGNFGNLVAGLYAWKFGMPVNGFIAAMNSNNALGDLIGGKSFVPHNLINTNSPALDVCVPSNTSRLESFYNEAPAVMRNMVYSASVDSDLTMRTIEQVYGKYGVYIDSSTAVAYSAAAQVSACNKWKGNVHTVVLATGHYAKEAELIRRTTGMNVTIPVSFRHPGEKVNPIAIINPDIDAFENVIASCF